jgi:hypothetical protein
MNQRNPMSCPVCPNTLRELPTNGDRSRDIAFFDCPFCGTFGLTRQAEINIRRWLDEAWNNVVIFAHALRRMQMADNRPLVDSRIAEVIMDTGTLPSPHEQADLLIRWLGANVVGPGEMVRVSDQEHSAIIGALTANGFVFVLQGLIEAGLIVGHFTMGANAEATLTFQGWARYEELLRGAPSGRHAFMALKFGDPTLDRMVNEYFRLAVRQTGFDLRRLDDEPRAGLIDDRLRVEIQGARFLIADLTHSNPGSYWEAGYAEGLGKPVIYTCKKSVFDTSHFDTNHHLHIMWEEADPKAAAENLKATIRATMPEAKRTDD